MNIKFDYLLKGLAKAAGVVVETEVKFCETRRWRFDYAIPARKIAIEYEGQGGRHNSFVGYGRDCEKYNEAILLGWRVFRITPWHFKKENYNNTLRLLDIILGGKI